MLSIAAAALVVFPGPVREPRSPRPGVRIFYREHVKAKLTRCSSTTGMATSPASPPSGVAWSTDGQRVFLQDNWGSNVADCDVFTPMQDGVHRVELTKLIQRTPGRPRGAEAPNRSHYYVVCDHWRSADEMVGTVEGHTDQNPSHDFDHPFSYDAVRHRIRWTRWRAPGSGA